MCIYSRLVLSSILLAVFSLVGGDQRLLGESTASTPIGFVKLTGKKNADLPFSIPLNRSMEDGGKATSVSSNTITVTGKNYAINQYVYANGVQPNHYFILIVSGVLQGKSYDIISNAANTITVDPNHPTNSLAAQNLAADDQFAIFPYWTLGTLFPNGKGVPSSPDPFDPKGLILVRDASEAGIRRAPSQAYLYHDGRLGDAGWYDANDLGAGVQNDVTLPREAFYVLRNLSASDQGLCITGQVPIVAFTTEVGIIQSNQAQDSYVGAPFPIPMSLTESKLVESGAFKVSTDPFAPKDLLITYDSAIAGIRPAASKAYLYYQVGGSDDGWYNANTLEGPLDDSKIFVPGGAYIIRKAAAAAGTTTWVAPLPYSLGN